MKQAIIYTLKVWFSTILFTPLLRLLMEWAFKLPFPWVSISDIEYYKLAVFYGMIFSAPAAVMLCIFIIIINRKPISMIVKKTYIITLVFIEMMLTFYYIFWMAGSVRINTIMTAPYLIIAFSAIRYYKLKLPVVTQQ